MVMARAIKLLESKIRLLEADNTKLVRKIEADRPKVIFADSVSASEDCKSINELAKILVQNGVKTGQNRLYDTLHKEGYLCAHGQNYNLPTQQAMEMRLFRVKEVMITSPDGSPPIIRHQTMVTGKGFQYFVNRYKRRM